MNIRIKDLCFSYREKSIFKHLDLELQPGRFTILLGANGSGKSTLLKLLCGLLTPQSGNILLDQKDLARIPLRMRAQQISVMLQTPVPALDFTAAEFVLWGRSAKLPRLSAPAKEDLEAAEQAMQSLGIQHFSSRKANALSGGEFQRLCIAAALALQSPVLLLDEPCSAQDPAQTALIFELLKNLAQERLLLVITHDLALARIYGERVLLLDEKGVFADGSADKVITPENLQRLYRVPDLSVTEKTSYFFETAPSR